MPDSMEAVVIALVTVMPGFVANAIWSRRQIRRQRGSDLTVVLHSLIFSALIQVVLGPVTIALIYPYRDAPFEHPWRLTAWGLIALLLAPYLLGLIAGRATEAAYPARQWLLAPDAAGWRRRLWPLLPPVSPPTAWDLVSAGEAFDGRFVVLQFKDGRRVAGAFGLGSAATNTPEPPGLFLSREWQLDADGDLATEVPCSRGVLIPSLEEVLWVRILAPPNEADDSRTP